MEVGLGLARRAGRWRRGSPKVRWRRCARGPQAHASRAPATAGRRMHLRSASRCVTAETSGKITISNDASRTSRRVAAHSLRAAMRAGRFGRRRDPNAHRIDGARVSSPGTASHASMRVTSFGSRLSRAAASRAEVASRRARSRSPAGSARATVSSARARASGSQTEDMGTWTAVYALCDVNGKQCQEGTFFQHLALARLRACRGALMALRARQAPDGLPVGVDSERVRHAVARTRRCAASRRASIASAMRPRVSASSIASRAFAAERLMRIV